MDENKMTTNVDKGRFGPWAVVTGASSGLGREFGRQLAHSGINVVLVARRGDELEAVGVDLRRMYGVDYRVIVADLSRREAIDTVVSGTADLDVGLLVSNAGAGRPGNFLAFCSDDLTEIVQLNALSHTVLTNHFSKRFKARGGGATLLVSAMGGDSGIPYNAIAAATKGLINTLGKSLHAELKAFGVGITVVVVSPTETPIIDKMGLRAAPMPIKPMRVDQCVAEALEGLKRNRMMVLPGRLYRIMNALMPQSVMRSMTGRMMQRSSVFLS